MLKDLRLLSIFQSNKKIISEQKNLESQQRLKMKQINNPESMTTGTEDLSSGASNRSKTTMGTETDCTASATEKIQINIEFELQKDSVNAQKRSTRKEKAEYKQ